ncbi:hypothetical protein ACI78R_08030 [Geodermatophilus sp. SYSU D01106]
MAAERDGVDTALRPVVPPLPSLVRVPEGQADAAQEFVNRLRAAAPRFAEAALAESAVVREVVPPARHRRARCRIVLRAADGGERDLTFVGTVDRPSPRPGPAFEEQIARWLAAAPAEEDAGLVDDDESPDGVAIDLTAWTPPAAAPALPPASVPGAPAVSPVVPPVTTLPTVAMPAVTPGAGLPTQVRGIPVAG